jgi:hypothetical protein
MSKHKSTKLRILPWIVILAQILALTSTGVLTALGVPSGPTPHLAQATALARRKRAMITYVAEFVRFLG